MVVIVESTTRTDERKRKSTHESDIETTTTETDGAVKSTIVVEKNESLVTIVLVTETNLLVTRGTEGITIIDMNKLPVSAGMEMKSVKAVATIRRRQGRIESQGNVVPATVTRAIEGIDTIERDVTENLENAAIVKAV